MRQRELMKLVKDRLAEQHAPVLHLIKVHPSNVLRDTEPRKCTNSQEAADLMRPYYSALNLFEESWVLYLNRNNQVMSAMNIGRGGLVSTPMMPELVYSGALLMGSVNMIVSHNHPSGVLRPSQEDIAMTRKMVEGAKCLNITLMDHVIISETSYFSFADNGML